MWGGQNEYYFAKKYPSSSWVGLDINDYLFSMFKKYAGEDVENVTLMKGDWFNLEKDMKGKFEGVISLQSLSWLSEWEKPVQEICNIDPEWIAFSSLFYEGKIEYIIRSKNHERQDESNKNGYKEAFYNIYSIPIIKEYLFERGYTNFVYEPFHIDIDLPKPDHMDWGTYTVKTETGERLQISAAMLMPWYFIFASKNGTK